MFSRTLGIVMGVLTTTALVVAIGCADAFGPLSLPGGVLAAIVAAATLGAAVGVTACLLTRRELDRAVRALTRHIESLRHEPLTCEPPPAPSWLRPVADHMAQILGDQRKRLDALTAARRELEIQLRIADAERRHAEAILQSISDAVLVTDAFNEVALANDSAARTLRFSLDGARHQPVDRVLRDPTLVKLIKDTRESGNARCHRQVEHHVHVDGREQVFDVTLSCVTNPQREVAGVVTILHDVTHDRELSELKSDFVSGVSHELRTPLSSIKAYIEMLIDGEAPDDKTRDEFYHIIQTETNRLSRLIDNILNISRIESGLSRIERTSVAMPEVIRDVIETMRPQAQARRIELNAHLDPGDCLVHGDRDLLYQALLNLVGNAIKYTPEGGRIAVDAGVDEAERTVFVHVTDNGVGIPEKDLPHLFDKFYRVEEHKKIAKGTGLGLNLVKNIVETVHGGGVRVHSRVGEGSTFSIHLPWAEEGR